jgi:hypothetical protein
MGLPVLDVPNPTFEESNPFLAGMKYNAAIRQQQLQNEADTIKNQYLGPTLAEALQQAQLQNQITAPKAEHAEEITMADLLQQQNQGKLTGEQAQWYGPKTRSEIALQGAQAGYAGAQTREANSLLPYKIKEAEFKAKYPLLSASGVAQQVGALSYMNQNPDQFNPPSQQQVPTVGSMDQGVQLPQDQQQPTLGNALAQSIPSLFNRPQQQEQYPQQQPVPQQAPVFQPQPQAGAPQQQQPQTLQDALRQSIFNTVNEQKAKSHLYEQRAELADLATMPKDSARALYAQTLGAGIDATQTTSMLKQGMNLDQMMATKGYKPGHYPPMIFAPSVATITSMQTREMAGPEGNILADFIIDAVAPYSQTIFGYSGKQMADQIVGQYQDTVDSMLHQDNSQIESDFKNSNEEQQARFLAAQQMLPEYSAVMFRRMNGKQLGIEVMDELQDASRMKVKALRSLTTPKVWARSQQIKQDMQNKAANASTQINYFENPENKTMATQYGATNNQTVKIQDPSGGVHVISRGKLEDALKKYPGTTVVG